MLAVLLVLAQQQVEYSTVAKRTELIVADLAKATGRRLECSVELRDEPLFIHVKAADADVLLAKVAFALRADWTTKDGVTTLGRSAARNATNDSEDEQAIKRMVLNEFDASFPGVRSPIQQESLDQLALDLSLIGKIDEARMDEARMEWYAIDPLIRAIPALLEDVDWSVVRRSWGAHAVFASHPVAFEARLSSQARIKTFDGIVRDMQAIQAACEKRGVKPSADWATSQWERAALYASQQGGKVYLRTGLPYRSVGIALTDANGTEWLNQGTGSKSGPDLPKASEVGFDPSTLRDQPFFTPRTKELRQLIIDPDTKPSEQLRAELLDPLTHDPRSFADSDFAMALAIQLDANVVIAFSDLDRLIDYVRGPRDGSLRQSLVPFFDLHAVKLEDGWLIARPIVLTGHEYSRLDRRAFASIIKRAKDNGDLDLTEFVKAVSPAPSFFWHLAPTYLSVASENLPINNDYDGAPLEFGTLYRAMTNAERRNVATTGLRVSSLSPKARDAFRFHIWPVVESQITHDPENPRPYHGWTHPLTSPPEDLTVHLVSQRIDREERAFRDGRWTPVPKRAEFDSFFGKQLDQETGDAMFRFVLERDFKGRETRSTAITRVVFKFASREWSRTGEIGFNHPTGRAD